MWDIKIIDVTTSKMLGFKNNYTDLKNRPCFLPLGIALWGGEWGRDIVYHYQFFSHSLCNYKRYIIY